MRMGRVDFSGVAKDVCLEYVPEAVAGDFVVVHVGFAISTLAESEAMQLVELLGEIEDFAASPPPEGEVAAP